MEYKRMQFDNENRPTPREIMTITGVSERTARRWLRYGGPDYAIRYIELSRAGRILPESWPWYWRFNHLDLLETDSNFPALKHQQLTWFKYVMQAWHQSLEVIPQIQASIDYLIKLLPKAEVVQLESYKRELEEIQRKSWLKPMDVVEELAAANDKEMSRRSGC
jgi:hypothetical protein